MAYFSSKETRLLRFYNWRKKRVVVGEALEWDLQTFFPLSSRNYTATKDRPQEEKASSPAWETERFLNKQT